MPTRPDRKPEMTLIYWVFRYQRLVTGLIAAALLGWLSATLILDLASPFGLTGADRAVGLVLCGLGCLALLNAKHHFSVATHNIKAAKSATMAYLRTGTQKRFYLKAFGALVAAAVLWWLSATLIFSLADPFGLADADRAVGLVLCGLSCLLLKDGVWWARVTWALTRVDRKRTGGPYRSWPATVQLVTSAVLAWLSVELFFGPFALSALPAGLRLGLAAGAAGCGFLTRGFFRRRV